jgi:hypothetical protein
MAEIETSSAQTLAKLDNLRKLEDFDTLSKLRQGYKVTDIEKESLLTLLSGVETDVGLVDTEVARLRAAILELKSPRASLVKAAGNARSLADSLRKLPLEILAEIFFLTYSSINFHDGRKRDSSIADHDMPIVLTGNVCSSWRNIAISTPKLWSSITITMNREDLPPWALQRLQKVLELSGNVLLDLTVRILRLPRTIESLASTAVFPLIHKHSRRCKQLVIRGHIDHLDEFFRTDLSAHSFNSESGALSLQLPSLRNLFLSIINHATQEGSRKLDISSTSAPNLRLVSIKKLHYYPRRLSVELPWGQLDTLLFGVDHLSELFNALSRSTCVARVWLYDCYSSACDGQTQFLHPISSNTLTSLEFTLVDNTEYDAMTICFDNLTLTNLQELHFYADLAERPGAYYSRLKEWPMDSFRAFAKRSGSPITLLETIGVPMRDSTLIAILECLPQLEVLVTAEPYLKKRVEAEGYRLSFLTNRLLERLQVPIQESIGIIDNSAASANVHASLSGLNHEAADSDSARKADPFLPYLKKVCLDGKGSPGTFSFKTFLKMVRSRCAPTMAHPEDSTFTLNTIELRIWDQPIDEAVREEIDSLQLSHDKLVLDVVSDFQVESDSDWGGYTPPRR